MTDPDATARIDSDLRHARRESGFEGQFAPGTIIAGRYRIASILGSGGMGEVYRADDTKLGQTVALKFLPARLARDPILLGRLHDEVRLGRVIAHPNVCRLYDIVDWEGAHFVAMEYVDGEDLSRLLRRIGRLAHDKAVDIARGIAAGLMAAHAKGILHRDLKPANVMIDSNGDARIMDFGLALAAGEDDGTISGTPAYMAPEQLSGEAATIQSDLYSLGLVMYELFTGKRAHSARTVNDRVREITSEITTPSSLIRDIDPAVERIILRCLSNDPAQRPRSAREVIHSLPGGDPLAAALAAGETPSPRIVAAAGAEGSLKPWVAWTLLGSIAVLLAFFVGARYRTSIARLSVIDDAPAVVWRRAQDVVRTLGVPAQGQPVRGTYTNTRYTEWLLEQPAAQRREVLRNGPGAYRFRLEYGPSPRMSRGLPLRANAPGWTTVEIDPRGRLTYLLVAPSKDLAAKPTDWRPLLTAAGFDPATLQPIAPREAPAAPFDARAAWRGTYPNDRTPIHVEAAVWRGTPVFFMVRGAWDDTSDATQRLTFGSAELDIFVPIVGSILFLAAFLLAWRNLVLRRGDRQGAWRVTIALFLCLTLSGLLRAISWDGFVAAIRGFPEIFEGATFSAFFLFLMYMALEPHLRRRWPEQLISWARLIGGRPRDPLVGRHVLIGLLGGMAHGALAVLGMYLGTYPGDAYTRIGDVWQSLGNLAFFVTRGVLVAAVYMVLLVILTMILRKRSLAIGGLLVANIAFFMLAVAGQRPAEIPAFIAVSALVTFITVRYGLLAIAVTQASFFAIISAPDLIGGGSIATFAPVALIAVLAMAIWAFRVSLGGQSPFNASLLDE